MWLVMFEFIFLIILSLILQARGEECPSNKFDCGNGKCIPEFWRCDGRVDCANENDERDCDVICPSNHMKCGNGKCIPKWFRCDGEDDCGNANDERECERTSSVNQCQSTQFRCKSDKTCISKKWQCDGTEDCDDGSDEKQCDLSNVACIGFKCENHECINLDWQCDGFEDCSDGSDEKYCPQDDTCNNKNCSQNCRNTSIGAECFCNDGYEQDVKDNKTCNDINECKEEGFCSHKCINSIGSYSCICQNGYNLVNRTCKAKGADPVLIFSTLDEIRGFRLRSKQNFLVRRSITLASAVDVNLKNGRIYWIEISNRSAIYSVETVGSDFKTVISHGLLVPEDIAVDYIANNIYITDSGLQQILVCKIEDSMCHVLHDTNAEKPSSIALDPQEGVMYWSDYGEQLSGIYKSDMDGSGRISLVSKHIGWPKGIAIDRTTNRLYWADAKLKTIEYITLDGSSRKVVLNFFVHYPFSLAVFEDDVYWSDKLTYTLESCNKFNGRKLTIMASENGLPIMGVEVYHPVLVVNVPNPCLFSDCSHICLISRKYGFICACPPGFVLSTDQKTCIKDENGASIFVSEGSSVIYIKPKSVGSETLKELPLSLGEAIITRVSYDSRSRHLFVADVRKPAIYMINMTSLQIKDLVSDVYPEDLAFDWKSNNLYWIDSSKKTAEVINVNLLRRIIILRDLMPPVALAISPFNGHMFIATTGIQVVVTMYGMDGKNKRILKSVKGVPMLLALHPSKTILYWADPQAGAFFYLNYTSSNRAQVLKTGIDGVMSLAASDEYIYWTAKRREFNLLKKNVTYVLQLPGVDRGSVRRKVTYIPGFTKAGMSQCLENNGGCSYVCLTSSTGRTCACSSEMFLSADNVTCVVEKCGASDFKCLNGRCLRASQRCDGRKDCDDGSDELNCSDTCENMACLQSCEIMPTGPRCYCNNGFELDMKDNKTCNDIDECQLDGFCSQECLNTIGSYRCVCEAGYELINRTCRVRGSDSLLIFSSKKEIYGMRLRLKTSFSISRTTTWGLDFDFKNERIYGIEISKKAAIFSVKVDGSDFRTILSHGLLFPEDIAVDYIANNLYITDWRLKQVLVCRIDGTMCHVLHDAKSEKPHSIVLDLEVGLMYWSDCGEKSAGIYRSGMDGSGRISFVSNGTVWPYGIALDHSSNRLYWADFQLNTIEFITLDGKSRKVILKSSAYRPHSLAVFEDSVYWSDWSTFTLKSCNKFTGYNVTTLISKKDWRILKVNVLYHPVLTAKGPNPCRTNYCSHMCLISPEEGFRCACPNGFKLSTDKKTCLMESHGASVFVSEGSSIFYIRPESIGNEAVTKLPLSLGEANITKVAYDSKSRYLFVADVREPAIYAINMTSNQLQVLVKNDVKYPVDLAFDWKGNNLYWIDFSKRTAELINVYRHRTVTLLTELMTPVALAISPSSGHMFIATIGIISSVAMYGMDGKNMKILNSGQGMPTSLALHPSKSILYWADSPAETIFYVNYADSSSAKILKSGISGLMSVTADEEYIYWTDKRRALNMLKNNKTTYELQLPGQEKVLVDRKVAYSPGMKSEFTQCLIDNGGCSYICLISTTGRTCACPSDMSLSKDNVTCVGKEVSEVIFTSEKSNIFVNGQNATDLQFKLLPLSLGTAITGLSYDSKSRKLFVADEGKPAIYAINMSSFRMWNLVINRIASPKDIAFDWTSNNLYWVDSSKGTVEVISVDKLKRIVLLKDLGKPVSLALSPNSGYMFVATIGKEACITMYGMDGKNKRILNSIQGLPMSLALHPSKTILYWTDPRAGMIMYVNYTRSSAPWILKSGINGLMSVAVSEEDIYWTAQEKIVPMALERVHVNRLAGQENKTAWKSIVYSSGKLPGKSECLIDNGGCSYICLTSQNGRTCTCSSAMTLSNEEICLGKKCEDRDFKCADGECIPAEMKCDGSIECNDGSDELDCDKRSSRPISIN